MTRLDASSEPSMEDILASIRKIIAEQPPGSRPVPASTNGVVPPVGAPLFSKPAPVFSRDAASGVSPGTRSPSTPSPVHPQSKNEDPFAAFAASERRSWPETGAAVLSQREQPASTKTASEEVSSGQPRAAGSDAADVTVAETGVQPATPAQDGATYEEAAAGAAPTAASLLDGLVSGKTSAQGADVLAASRGSNDDQTRSGADGAAGTAEPVSASNSISASSTQESLRSHGLPGATEAAPKTAAVAADDADPFSFDLGPSPFARDAGLAATAAEPVSFATDANGIAPKEPITPEAEAVSPQVFDALDAAIVAQTEPEPAQPEMAQADVTPAAEEERQPTEASATEALSESVPIQPAEASGEAGETAPPLSSSQHDTSVDDVLARLRGALDSPSDAVPERQLPDRLPEEPQAASHQPLANQSDPFASHRHTLPTGTGISGQSAAGRTTYNDPDPGYVFSRPAPRHASRDVLDLNLPDLGRPPESSPVVGHPSSATAHLPDAVTERVPPFAAVDQIVAEDVAEPPMPEPSAEVEQPVVDAIATAVAMPGSHSESVNGASTSMTKAFSGQPDEGFTEGRSLTVSDPDQRALEDTVADLLRPMLKSWLAENMPKIVERALRREISELNLTRRNTAAE